MNKSVNSIVPQTDIALIGAGIMSATPGIILKELNPNITIQIFERLDEPGQESSDAWNNAGTGHSAFCELNYTSQKADGSVDILKAIKICQDFEISREFWSYLVEKKYLPNPKEFVRPVPHMSFVWGDENVQFLKKRFDAMHESVLFKDMQLTQDRDLMQQWMPLIMKGRTAKNPLAATSVANGHVREDAGRYRSLQH